MLYFAYGSNMNLQQMKFRCPHACLLGWGCVPDWQVTECRFANIEYHCGAKLYGAIFEISHKFDWNVLDWYEGFPKSYVKTALRFYWFDTLQADIAVIYKMTQRYQMRNRGISYTADYRSICSQGAIDCRLPVNVFSPIS